MELGCAHDTSGAAAGQWRRGWDVLAEAINRAKSTEAEAIVKALQGTNIPGDQVIYPWKGIQFDPKTQQNVHATGTLVQIQDQQYVTVWPFESAAKDVIWPFPAWKSRK